MADSGEAPRGERDVGSGVSGEVWTRGISFVGRVRRGGVKAVEVEEVRRMTAKKRALCQVGTSQVV